MKRNSRLSLALHTLGHMANEPERIRTSASTAAHAGTKAVVVPRVLGSLRQAGLLISECGHPGGWWLATPAKGITLADVYRALDERFVPSGEVDEVPDCPIERALRKRIATVLDDIEHSLIARLAETSIADVSSA